MSLKNDGITFDFLSLQNILLQPRPLACRNSSGEETKGPPPKLGALSTDVLINCVLWQTQVSRGQPLEATQQHSLK